MTILAFFAHWQSHSIAGLAFAGGLIWYLHAHPEAFTPASYTECAGGLLATLLGTSAAKAYQQHRFKKAPESQPVAPLATPLPKE